MHPTRSFTFSCLALVMLLGLSGRAFSSIVAAGTNPACKPSLVHFATIQLAVNAVPAGSTVDVCPGTYPEQVVINKNLTLQGVADAGQDAAVIVAPGGGLLQNTSSLATGNPIAAQILVQAPATSVKLSNLTVDGSNNGITGGCPGTGSPVPDPMGIYYQNASGTVTRASVLNEVLGAGLTGCQGGLGIFVQSGGGGTSTVSITNNNVENYQKNGITGNEAGTTVTIKGNTVIGQGPTSGAAENSIQIGFGATGSISGNTVGSDVWTPDVFGDTGDAAAGLLVYASQSVAITSNNVNNTQYGIALAGDPSSGSADHNVVTKNTVSTTHLYDGIDLCGNYNTASNNAINGSDESGVHVDDTCNTGATGNNATFNTINSACAGILIGPSASSSTTVPNTYYNVGTLQLSSTNVCTPALKPVKKSAVAKVSAARP
jgi:Periplasmic copper-binding protein (NosD)